MNEKMSLIEIKDQTGEYHWLMAKAEDHKLERLIFKSMSEEIVNENKINVRKFTNAELRFDELFGKFVLGDELFILKNCSKEDISPRMKELIQSYL